MKELKEGMHFLLHWWTLLVHFFITLFFDNPNRIVKHFKSLVCTIYEHWLLKKYFTREF